MSYPSSDQRSASGAGSLLLIDAIKALAAQLILLHHLALYGPMSDVVRPMAAGLVQWLEEDARMAVQVFLVIAGFLSARSLAPDGFLRTGAPVRAVGRRFLRLAVPYWVAIVLAVAAAAIARRLTELDHTPAPPTLAQLAANFLMLQDPLGMEALSAGLWYVAIDLQLYGLFALLLWLGSVSTRSLLAVWLVAGMALASLLYFNRIAALDVWALYFFGAYGLGALAWWGTRLTFGAWLLLAIAFMTLAALAVEWRTRLALAGMTALALAWGSAGVRWHLPTGLARIIHALGKTSYAVFLTHYPVCLLFNALAGRFWPASPAANMASLLLAWITSLLAGACLYRWVEAPVNALLARRAQERPPG